MKRQVAGLPHQMGLTHGDCAGRRKWDASLADVHSTVQQVILAPEMEKAFLVLVPLVGSLTLTSFSLSLSLPTLVFGFVHGFTIYYYLLCVCVVFSY